MIPWWEQIFNFLNFDMEDKKIAFVIGHTNGQGPVKDKGAWSEILEDTEFEYWLKFSEKLTDLGDVFTHSEKITSYTQRQKSMAVKTKNYDLIFELHFNNSANPQAHGCEALHYFSNKVTKRLAEKYCEEMNSKMSIRNRGAKATFNGNGYGFLKEMRAHAVLLEPFFGSNQEDVDLFDQNKYVEVIKSVIEEFKAIK